MRALLVAPLLMLTAPTAHAARISSETIAFAQNARSLADFLDRSSRLALIRSKNEKLREFARAEAIEQTATANAIAAWNASWANAARATIPNARTRGGLVTLPLRTAGSLMNGMADEMDRVQEGRSVAEDADSAPPIRLKDIVLPALTENLAKLSAANGRAFDALYESTQRDALLQLSTVYASYIQNGRDAALRALATRELPKINMRLALIP